MNGRKPKGGDKPPTEIFREQYMPITVRIHDAVRLTGISRARLYELIRVGKIETVKLEGSRLILVESLHALINALRDKADSDKEA